MTTMSVAEARNNLAEVVNKVSYGGERIVFTRHGKPAAALVHVEDYEFLQRLENELDIKLASEALQEYELNPASAIPLDEIMKHYVEEI